jgi:hypothetical protein
MIEFFPTIWMRAVCTRSVPTVLSLYRPDAVLVPTYDPDVLQGHAQLRAYFRSFLSKENLCGKIDGVVVQNLGAVRSLSGLYTFHFIEDYKPQTVQARFTYVLVPEPGASGPTWKIATHHSSEVPA